MMMRGTLALLLAPLFVDLAGIVSVGTAVVSGSSNKIKNRQCIRSKERRF